MINVATQSRVLWLTKSEPVNCAAYIADVRQTLRITGYGFGEEVNENEVCALGMVDKDADGCHGWDLPARCYDTGFLWKDVFFFFFLLHC